MMNKSTFLSLFSDVQNKFVYKDGAIGFSLLRPSEKRSGYASLMRVYIDPKESNLNKDFQQIVVSVSYGEHSKENNSISMNLLENEKHDEPIDIVSKDYVFDRKKKRILKRKSTISGRQLVENMFHLHLKPTRKFSGAYIRLKLIMQRRFIPSILRGIITILTTLLRLLTGDRYKYTFFFGEEIESIENSENKTKEDNQGKKFKIFDYSASLRVIIVYALLHLAVYYFYALQDWTFPAVIKNMFDNTFLVALYSIISLAFLDVALPRGFKYGIRQLSRLASWFQSKAIRV